MPGSCLSKAQARPCKVTELAQDKPKSPGRCWVSQRVLDTVEEHLAQEVHGLEDVLHGVDPAWLREEGEWGTGSGQGTRVQPLMVLSWAVQGQLGTVARGPVPP